MTGQGSWQAPGLLIFTGTLFGLVFPLGKAAAAAGVPPVLWAIVASGGAALFLAPRLLRSGRLAFPRGRMLRYTLVSGLMSFGLVNLLIFWLIPRAGAGYTGLMFALSPVATLALSVLAGLKAPRPLGLAGVAIGCAGAAMVVLGRDGIAAGADAGSGWPLAALALPLLLGLGNVYRTLDWPEGASPAALAFWSHLWALCGLLGLQLWTNGDAGLSVLAEVPAETAAQAVAAGIMFPAYFRLQRLGGPVMLSQIGYVAAAVGLAAGTLLFGEAYSLATWSGASVIAAGISCTVLSQAQPQKPAGPARA